MDSPSGVIQVSLLAHFMALSTARWFKASLATQIIKWNNNMFESEG